jgi:protein-tyrosine phosphatase
MVKTSATHPLRVDWVSLVGQGRIGMTFCPGKIQPVAWTGRWRRDLGADLLVLRRWGCRVLLSLLEEPEYLELGVPNLGAEARRQGIEWYPLPITDGCAPDQRFAQAWPQVWPRVRDLLGEGGDLVVHCKGGLGRTGTLAACLLINLDRKSVV